MLPVNPTPTQRNRDSLLRAYVCCCSISTEAGLAFGKHVHDVSVGGCVCGRGVWVLSRSQLSRSQLSRSQLSRSHLPLTTLSLTTLLLTTVETISCADVARHTAVRSLPGETKMNCTVPWRHQMFDEERHRQKQTNRSNNQISDSKEAIFAPHPRCC